jgi:hypothetical protein
MKWTRFKDQRPSHNSIIKVKFGNGKILTAKVDGCDLLFAKSYKPELSRRTLASGQQEWREVGELRGKAPKPGRQSRTFVQDHRVVDPKNRPSEEELSIKERGKAPNFEKLVYPTIDRIKSGLSLNACKELICQEINPNTNRPYHERFAQDIVLRANALIKEDYTIQRKEVISQHMMRYDQEINHLLNYVAPINDRQPWLEEQANINARMDCLNVLHQKEELLGMHRKKFRLIINNEDEITVREKSPKIDLSKLTLEEKIELNSLIEKSRRTEDEISGVILNKESRKVIEDVDCEVIEEKVNIDRMENKIPISRALPQTSLQDAKEKIRMALRKKAQEEYTRVGSRTAENDNISNI